MKRTLMKYGAAVAAVLAVGGPTFLGAAPAHAALPSGQVAVAAGGSDTTEKVMGSAMNQFDHAGAGTSLPIDFGAGPVASTVRTYNIPASPAAYKNLAGNTYPVPGDGSCRDLSWSVDPLAPASNTAATEGIAPFGSSAGRNYLKAQDSSTVVNQTSSGNVNGDLGCIDFARSSSGTSGRTGEGNFEYYGFAYDAMTWGSTSLKAPPFLTRQQITDIYDCVVTDWSQVGGVAGPIARYMPQVGSGTRSFFLSDILVGKSSTYVPPNPGGACQNFTYVEENQANGTPASGTDPATPGIAAADIDKAILPYSVALWDFQAQNSLNPTIDRRCPAGAGSCVHLGAIKTAATTPVIALPNTWSGPDNQYFLDTAGVVNENNVKQENTSWSEAGGNFPGIRFVYNVLDTTGNRPGYQAAKQLVGFSNTSGGAKGTLCDPTNSGLPKTLRSIITSNGFAPISSSGGGNANLAGSTCREFPGPT